MVEDNLALSQMQKGWLEQSGYDVMTAVDEPTARGLVKKNAFDLVLSDVRLPEGNGISLLEWLRETGRHIPFIVMTGYASYADAVRAIKLGAKDYLPKPVHKEPLLELVHTLLKTPGIIRGETPIWRRTSPKALEAERLAKLVAPSDISVLILGPSGCGKESVAQFIHRESHRCGKPFVAVNCGGIPKELAVSEFFGHVKGAFTGADTDRKGYFDAAQGGTLFLDEIGNMPYELQIMLLRVLQECVYQPLGGGKPVSADVRIIAATNEDMPGIIKSGRFREDLYHRLNEFDLHQPSLRECPEDILPLAGFFRKQFAEELRRECDGFTADTERLMLEYPWSGNVREMRNRIKRAVLVTKERLLTATDLGLDSGLPAGTGVCSRNIREILQENRQRNGEQMKQQLLQALEETGHNISHAADLLGISRTTLYVRMQKYGLK